MHLGPGEYVADPTEGITDPQDLPQPRIERCSRNLKRHPCPQCGHPARRDRELTRTLHDLGDLRAGRPVDLQVTYSHHYCAKCRKYFSADLSGLAPPYSHYTQRVIELAVRVVSEDGVPYRAASWHLWRDHRVFGAGRGGDGKKGGAAGGKKGGAGDGRGVSGRGAGRVLRLPRGR